MTTVETKLAVRALAPRVWVGRYPATPGNPSTALHVRSSGGEWWPVVDWALEGMVGNCWLKDGWAARSLASAVNSAKTFVGGAAGGAFLVNEWGQVLVPSNNGSRKIALAGVLEGQLEFENPFDSKTPVALAAVDGLRPGDAWKWPYVGCRYNLSKRHEIYCQKREGNGVEFVPRRDDRLVDALRSVRPHGAVRFLVNPAGVVLTKRPAGSWDEETWAPVYVGQIRPDLWFAKES